MTVTPNESVMTSAFFFAPNFVRGYAGDNRPVMRVSSDNAFGVGPETIYLDFTGFSPMSFQTVVLSMESMSGGFGADADAANPFTVSAHAVSTDPFATIIDDTNPGGTISWSDFYANEILDADPAALTVIDGFGTVTFDVTGIVELWESDAGIPRVIALTGINDVQQGNGFLHGFANETEAPGATSLTAFVVPEPSAALLIFGALGGMMFRRRKGEF